MKDKFKGTTLIEILVAIALFGLFLTAASLTLVQGYRSYTRGGKAVFLFRMASIGMDQMTRTLHTCETIYVPDNLSAIERPAWFIPKEGTATPVFVFRRTVPGTSLKEVIAYKWNSTTNEISQFIYSNSFPADETVLLNTTKVIATSVQDFQFQLEKSDYGETITVRFASYPDKSYFPLMNFVNIRESGL